MIASALASALILVSPAYLSQDDSKLANPYLLEIGLPGTVSVPLGKIVRTDDGTVVTLDQVVESFDSVPYVLLGEQHATTEHQKLQAQIIEALVKRGRTVVVGMEMLTRPMQPFADVALAGWISDEVLQKRIDWKNQWGFDFSFYKPIFDVVRKYQLSVSALNVPRDWVRTVGRSGYEGLSPEVRATLPIGIDLKNSDHRSVFTSLMGGHPMTGARGENVYAAQVLWDEGMAQTALLAFAKIKNQSKPIVVILAGSGHVMYGAGINYRLKRQSAASSMSVVMVTGLEEIKVSKGLGNFVFASKTEAKPVEKGG